MAGKPDDDDLPLVGDDGWPLGGPSDAEVKRAAKARFERDMQAALARWQGGDLTAFALAIQLYWRQHREFPHELVQASKVLVERAMAEDERRARREWERHRYRWELLVELRQRRDELSDGTSLERARMAVSEALQNTPDPGQSVEGSRNRR